MTSDSDAISENATATAMTLLRVTNPTNGMNQARYHGSNQGEQRRKIMRARTTCSGTGRVSPRRKRTRRAIAATAMNRTSMTRLEWAT